MKKLLAIFLFAALMDARGGIISGTVHAQGKGGADAGASSGKYDSKKFKFAEKVNYDELRDFVVFIEGSLTNLHLLPPTKHVQIVSQKDATFRPHVVPIMAGTNWAGKSARMKICSPPKSRSSSDEKTSRNFSFRRVDGLARRDHFRNRPRARQGRR